MTHRFRAGAFLLALALLAGACGGGGDDTNKISQDEGAVSGTTFPPRVSTTAGDGDVAAGSATTVKGGSGGGGGGGSTATTRRTTGTTAGGGGGAYDINTIPSPAKTGTYVYSQTGTSPDGPVPGSGTLVVKGGGPTQTLSRYYDTSKPPQDLTIEYRSDGPALTGAVLRFRGVGITCNFAKPVTYPPYPPTTGKTFSGTATCSNGLKASIAGSVVGQNKSQVQGKTYDVIVTTAALSVTGFVNATVNLTQWYAPQLGVPTYTRETFEVQSPPTRGDVTSSLSTIP